MGYFIQLCVSPLLLMHPMTALYFFCRKICPAIEHIGLIFRDNQRQARNLVAIGMFIAKGAKH
jgi:hypothetical protein